MKKLLAAAFAALALLACSAIAAEKPMTLLQASVVAAEKSTRNAAPYCNAIYLEDAQKDGETLAVYAMPAFCDSVSFSFAGEFRDMRRVNGVKFFFFKRNESFSPPPIAFNIEPGDGVLVVDNQPMEFSFGATSVQAFYTDPFALLAANVAGRAQATLRRQECTPSGCATSERVELYNLLVLDRTFGSFPGTAVVTADTRLVGMVVGQDAGKTLVMSASQLSAMLCRVLAPDNCRG